MFFIGLKLQRECSEQWVSDAWEIFLMLLCDIASLIRLSITIQFTSTLIALDTVSGLHPSQRARPDYNTGRTTARQRSSVIRHGKVCRLDSVQGPSYDSDK